MPSRIAVVGAGAPGLSSALRILQLYPGVEVTVIADKFYNETTSYGAAGIVSPFIDKYLENPIEKARKWVNASFRHYTSLAESSDSRASGVMFTSGYDLRQSPKQDLEVTPFVRNFRELTAQELAAFPLQHGSGHFFTTVMVECKYYLSWLKQRIEELGGKMVKRKISSFAELADGFDVIVNCAGLGNRDLLNDLTVRPARGQVFRMNAPWIKHFVYDRDRTIYLFSGRDNVVVGGTRQLDNYNREVDPGDTKQILEDAEKLVPQLKGATIEAQWVGLRPYRPTVRLERQVLQLNGKRVVMVHNYGHAAKGINLSWGTACEAAELVGETLRLSKL